MNLVPISNRVSFFCSLYRPEESEYIRVMPSIMETVRQHKQQLTPGEPQLNICDPAVMVIGFRNYCVNMQRSI